MKKTGFSLIELMVLIVVLGVLAITAAPKFLDITTDAHVAKNNGVGAAFKSGLQTAHAKAMVLGINGSFDDVQIVEGAGAAGQLDFNSNGFPIQQYAIEEPSTKLDNINDCMAVWNVILDSPPSISRSPDGDISDYQATYVEDAQCLYIYNQRRNLSIYYGSDTGQVIIDDDPTT